MIKVEKLSGRGNLYRHGAFTSKVRYALEVSFGGLDGLTRISGIMEILSDNDQFLPVWKYTQFTLHLKDKRAFELYCSNFNSDTAICNVEGTTISISNKQPVVAAGRGYKPVMNIRA